MVLPLHAPDNCPQALQYNGDIAGPGVRISFYIQNFILVLMVQQDPENALWTLVATSFGLTVAALSQLGQHQLTLLQGILVSQLGWFAIFGTYLSLASYSRSRGRDSIVKIVAVLQSYFLMILTIVMWAMADKLPLWSCLEESDVKFVFLFGWPLKAHTGGRKVGLVFSIGLLVVFTIFNFIEFRHWYKRRGTRRPHRRTRHRRRRENRTNRNALGDRHRWIPESVQSLLFGIVILQLLILVYFISTTELIITKSKAVLSDSIDWGFGQVLAMTLILPSLVSLLRGVYESKHRDPEEALHRDPGEALHRDREEALRRDREEALHTVGRDREEALPTAANDHQLTPLASNSTAPTGAPPSPLGRTEPIPITQLAQTESSQGGPQA